MVWHSLFPVGSVSVRANKSIGQDNTTYIETTMGNTIAGTDNSDTRDHFWAVSVTLDGRHRFIQSPKFEAPAGTAADPVMGAGMDACIFFRNVNADVGRIEGFYKTSDLPTGNFPNRYQFIPSFMSGIFAVTNTFATLTAIPKNVYGEIYMYRNGTSGSNTIQAGWFQSGSTSLSVVAYTQSDSGGIPTSVLRFSNSNLNLQVRTGSGSADNWQFRIIYRAV